MCARPWHLLSSASRRAGFESVLADTYIRQMIERRGGRVSELTIPYGEVLLRLLLTAALCGVIGFERETRDKSAGFRTHILLGLGGALFALVSAYGFAVFTEAAIE